MNNSNFTQEVRKIIVYGNNEARKLGSEIIEPEHILLAILKKKENEAVKLLESFTLLSNIRLGLYAKIEVKNIENKIPSNEIIISRKTAKIMNFSLLELREEKNKEIENEQVSIKHLIFAMLKENNNLASKVLNDCGITLEKYKEKAKELLKDSNEDNESQNLEPYDGTNFTHDDDDDDDIMDFSSNNNTSKKQKRNDTGNLNSDSDTPALDNYGTDVTKAAEEDRLDPIIGRDQEILRLAQILGRRKKNNPILIGEPGVGKSAIVEGLALRIVQRKVSRILFDKRIISLDLTSMVAGTKFRGQFEERVKAVIDELKRHKEIILFIDEIHTIIGAGNAQGSMDAANILKPALSRGEIQCIGATTLDEYKKSIEKDGALERRFQKIIVDPTTAEETLLILQNIKERYEQYHHVSYTDEAIKDCVLLTERYVSDRSFPDKAIDALDEAGSKVHLTNIVVPSEIESLEKEIKENNEKKLEAVNNQDFELAATFRDIAKKKSEELSISKKNWEKGLDIAPLKVDSDEIASAVSAMTGIHVNKIATAESTKLLKMKQIMKSKIIGQDSAVDSIVKAIQRNRVGLKDPNKPIGAFLLVGPTGVGKTLLAKLLADSMFGSKDSIIRIDMSEFIEKFTVSRLVGAPPGYVGYEEGGQLTEKVRRKPYSVVLLDEIEKAHKDVFNLLLQVMDEGRLTDSLGKVVSFKNTVIIMTSNVGTRQLKEFSQGIGFTSFTNEEEYTKGIMKKSLNKTFSPEFLNRIDKIINFNQLSKENILQIVDLELKSLYERIEKLGFILTITNAAKQFIAEDGYDKQFGARPLKRSIQNNIEDELAELLLKKNLKEGDRITADFNEKDKNIIFKINK